MTPWAWLFGILGTGGLVALVALAVLNPVRALALAKDVGAFLIDRLRAIVAWARDPNRNWWKVGCFSFAGFFALAAWYADGQRRAVGLATTKLTDTTRVYEDRLVTIMRDRDQHASAATTNFTALLQCQALLTAEVGAAQETARLNAEAVARAEAAAAANAAKLEAFRRRERPLECTDALRVLEEKCAAFSDY